MQSDGRLRVIKNQQTKIIPLIHFRGAMAYWGLAGQGSFQTYSWLRARAGRARDYQSVEQFVYSLANDLDRIISGMRTPQGKFFGIGIHLAAYERFDGYWIPELFLISTWTDTLYTAVHNTIHVSRETYHWVGHEDPIPEHRDGAYRLRVHEHLMSGGMLMYNNGDPVMYNTVANSIFGMISAAAHRGILADLSGYRSHCAIARRPIEIVAGVQHDFYRTGTQLVGGRLHDLAVTANADYYSTSGDV